MVGFGEQRDEVRKLLEDLRAHEVDAVTIGQYLQPTRAHLPVAEYVHPDVFEEYKVYGERLGFRAVFSGPLVRSSFMAEMVNEIADCGSRIAD
jgi:lipoic acid synthetase